MFAAGLTKFNGSGLEHGISSEPFPSTGKGWIGVPLAKLGHPHLDPLPSRERK